MKFRSLALLLTVISLATGLQTPSHAQIFDPNANRLAELHNMIVMANYNQGLTGLQDKLDKLEKRDIGIPHFQVRNWDMWAPENSNLLNIRLTGSNAQLHKLKQKAARKLCADSLRFIKEKIGTFEHAFVPGDATKAQADKVGKFIRTYSNIDLALEDRNGRERTRCNSYFGTSRISYRKNRS